MNTAAVVTHMIGRSHIIDAIRSLNPTAGRGWLDAFDTPALRRYLHRLEISIGPRGRQSIWIREGGTPAIVTRRPADVG